ncbi:MAG: DNA-binding response regulator [Chloroflexi bacterium RBG_16_50_9]|nr:MAG: DNA-binding response regulator [Chloroflexi bacterium RBG_16_50_9]
MSPKKASVLIVDDDIHMLRMMKRIMELEGFKTIVASSGEASLKIFDKESPDLVLLDIMMPDMDGYTLCRSIREFSQIPIIMVTAKGNEKEKIEGLDNGADDYVTKPFSTNELAARVRAVMRRTPSQDKPADAAFRYNDLIIDFTSHRVMVAGKEIELTPTEYKLLSYIACNAGRVITPDQLLTKVWGEEYIGDPHLLQVNIARLRQKLGDNARNPTYILTRPGIGYMMLKSHEV